MVSSTETEFQEISESGKVPSTRVEKVEDARAIVSKLVKANHKRSQVNALVKGLVDSNPPYKQADLNRNNQRYRSNFNTGEALSLLGVAMTSYYDLYAEVPHLASVVCRSATPNASDWGAIVQEEFDSLLRSNKSMDFNIQLSNHDMVLYGSGPVVWPDQYDWRAKPVLHSDVYYPDNTLADVYEFEYVAIRYHFTSTSLYQKIKDESLAAESGWNVDAVKMAIVHSRQKGANTLSQGEWERVQQDLRNNNLDSTTETDRIKVIRLLYKEYPTKDDPIGKVTERWFLESVSGDIHPDGFLLTKNRAYEDFSQVEVPFFIDKGDGKAHSVKGLGTRMYKLLTTKMRLDNALVDSAFARTALMFQATSSKAVSKSSIIPLGPYLAIPSDLKYVPTNLGGAINEPASVSRHLETTLSSNLSQYRQHLDKGQGNPRTATEVEASLAQQSVIGKTQQSRYYAQLDQFFAETFRRAIQDFPSDKLPGASEALEFQKNIQSRGVPLSALKDCVVTASRAVGQGSQSLRSRILDDLFISVGASLPEAGRKNLIKDSVANKAGKHMVDRYYPQDGVRTPQEQESQQEAIIENGLLSIGAPAMVTSLDDDYIHSVTHIEGMARAVESLPQGGDQVKVLTFLESAGPHVQQHLQKMSSDKLRESEVRMLNEQLKAYAGVADQLKDKVLQETQQKQKAQEQQEQVLSELQLKNKKVQAEIEMKREKSELDNEIKRTRHEQDMVIKDAMSASEIRNGR